MRQPRFRLTLPIVPLLALFLGDPGFDINTACLRIDSDLLNVARAAHDAAYFTQKPRQGTTTSGGGRGMVSQLLLTCMA